jgi:hypothetical protein
MDMRHKSQHSPFKDLTFEELEQMCHFYLGTYFMKTINNSKASKHNILV